MPLRLFVLFQLLLAFVIQQSGFAQCAPVPTTTRICAGESANIALQGLGAGNRNVIYYGYRQTNTAPLGVFNVDNAYPGLSATTVIWGRGTGATCPASLTPMTIRVGQTARAPGEVVCAGVPNFTPIAHYDFSRGLADQSGNGHNLQNGGLNGTGMATITADHLGRANGARYFNGNASLSTPATLLLNSPAITGEYTIAYWIRVDRWEQGSGNTFFSAGVSKGTASHTDFLFRLLPASLGSICTSNGWVTGGEFPNGVVLGRWTHMAASYNRDRVLLYINGELMSEIKNPPVTLQPDNNPLTLGYDPTGSVKTLNGAMADVYIYDRALTGGQIRRIAGLCNPVGIFPANETCSNRLRFNARGLQPGFAYFIEDSLGRQIGDTISVTGLNTVDRILEFPITQSIKKVRMGAYNWGCKTLFPRWYDVPDSVFNATYLPIEATPAGGQYCANTPVTIRVPNASSANVQVTWSNGTNGPSTVVNQPGTYTAIIRTNAGCLDTLNFTYRGLASPTPPPLRPDTLCPNNLVINTPTSGVEWSATYTDVPVQPTSRLYDITYPTGTDSIARIVLRPGAPIGLIFKVLRRSVHPITGCERLDSALYTIGAGVNLLRIGGDTNYCSRQPVNLFVDITSTDGDNRFSIRWSTGDTTFSIRVADPTSLPGQRISVTITQGTCTYQTSRAVRFQPIAQANAGPSQTVCWGSTTRLGADTAGRNLRYSWTSGSGPGQALLNTASAFQTSINWGAVPAPTAPVTYQFWQQVQDTVTGCADTSMTTLTVIPQSVALAGSDASFCAGNVTQIGSLVAMPTNQRLRWTPSTGLSSDTVARPLVLSLPQRDTAYVVRYVLTASQPYALACAARDTVLVRVNPKPRFSITGPMSVCPGLRAAGYKAILPVPAGVTVNWVSPVGTITSGQGTDSVTIDWPNIRAASVPLKALARNAEGCISDSVIIQIRVLPRLTPPAPLGDTASCINDSLFSYQTPQTPGSAYTWLPVGGTVVAGQGTSRATIKWSGVGNYSLSYRENTIADTVCEGTSPSINIRLRANPAPLRIQGIPTLCGPGVFDLSVPDLAGTSTFNWSVSPGLTLTSGQGGSRVNLAAATPGRYWVRMQERNSTGCLGKVDSLPLVVHAVPLASTGPDTSLCLGSSIRVGAPRVRGIRYAWAVLDGIADTTEANPVFTPSRVGTYLLGLSVVDSATGCRATASLNVKVDSLPYLGPTASGTTICQSEGLRLSTPMATMTSQNYLWQPATFLSNATDESPVLLVNQRLNRDTTLTYIRRAARNSSEPNQFCNSQDTIRIRVLARPNLNGLAGLAGGTVCANGNYTIPDLGRTDWQYQWQAAGMLQGSGGRLDTMSSASVGYPRGLNPNSLSRDTTISINLVVTRRGTGCVDSVRIPVTFRPVPAAVGGGSFISCHAEPGSVAEPVVLGTSAVSGYAYQWLSADVDQSSIARPTYQYPAGAPAKDTTVLVSVVSTDLATGCSRRDTARVTILLRPQVEVTADDTLCPGSSTTLQVRSRQLAQIITSTWYEGTTLLTRGPQLGIQYNHTGTTGIWKTYRVVTSRVGSPVCDTERSIRIWMDASSPISLAGNDPWLCPQKLVRRYAVAAAVPGARYVWAATSGTILSQDSTGVTIRWQEGAGDYELEVKAISSAGCITSTDRMTIREDRELQSPNCTPADYPLSLPNVITPNNDGVNDGLVVENAQYYPQLVFKLYNRYGVQLLSKQGMAETWHPSAEIVAGTYFYHLETGRGQVLKGWLEVVR